MHPAHSQSVPVSSSASKKYSLIFIKHQQTSKRLNDTIKTKGRQNKEREGRETKRKREEQREKETNKQEFIVYSYQKIQNFPGPQESMKNDKRSGLWLFQL